MAAAAELALFDLDNTLLSGDSDYEWAQFLIERGVLERAESADSGEHFRAQGPLREGLDRLDQRVPRVDVHPGVAVSDRFLAGQDWGCR